jgi:glycosyltransferase involved in cell wall biosynthesis
VLIFGQGPLEAELRADVAARGLAGAVRFTGFRHDLPRWLGGLDMLVHPADMEGLGVSLLQASAAGVPVVTSRAGGLPEAVQDGVTGILCPPGDVAALAAAIDRLAGDPALRRQYGAAGRARILAEFSIDAMVDGNLPSIARCSADEDPHRPAQPEERRRRAPRPAADARPARAGPRGAVRRPDGRLARPAAAGRRLRRHRPAPGGLYDLPSCPPGLYARRVGADLIHGHLTRSAWYVGWPPGWPACPMWPRPTPTTPASTSAAPTASSPCPAVADFLQREGYDPARIRMVHHGIADLAARLPADARQATRRSLGLADDEPCLLMAARIVPAKGHDTALRALARLATSPGPCCWPAITTAIWARRCRPWRELGIAGRVRFLGLREDVPALMAASDVLLAPSRREALSLTLLEASACALPIVATRVGGIGEVVEEGASGFLVAPDDPPALAAAIAPLLADPALRALRRPGPAALRGRLHGGRDVRQDRGRIARPAPDDPDPHVPPGRALPGRVKAHGALYCHLPRFRPR